MLHAGVGTVYRVEFEFNCALTTGTYFLNAGVVGNVNGVDGFLHRVIDFAMFRVSSDTSGFSTGIINFSGKHTVKEISNEED